MELISAYAGEEEDQLDDGTEGRAIGSEQAQAKKESGSRKYEKGPERRYVGPMCGPIHNESRGGQNTQNEERSACRPRWEHGKQSLHSRRLTGARAHDNLQRGGGRLSFRSCVGF